MEKNIDYDIEQYWYGLKRSMTNFYNQHLHFELQRPIEKWSAFLNVCQQKKEYTKIEEYIVYYISLYANDLMRLKDDYAINILYTNIKSGIKLVINTRYIVQKKIHSLIYHSYYWNFMRVF